MKPKLFLALMMALVLFFAGTSSSQQFIEIDKPQDGGEVSWMYTVEGNSSATEVSGLNVYVLVWPNEAFGPWWVQETKTYSDGSWESHAYFGRGPEEDVGTTYGVIAIVTDEELRPGQTFTEIPDCVVKSNSIKVTRAKALGEVNLPHPPKDGDMNFIEIDKPQDGEEVSWMYTVEGNSSATEVSGLNVYVLVWPNEAFGPWWVQETETCPDGSWESHAYFGRGPKEDVGTTYSVIAIVTDEKLRPGQTFGDLPGHVERSSSIEVTRAEAGYEWELLPKIPENETLVEITRPQDRGNVSWMYTIRGNSSLVESPELFTYVLIWPNEAHGPWWVQETNASFDGCWISHAYFGEDPKSHPEHIGTTYGVIAILIDQELKSGQQFRNLPGYVGRSNPIEVTRSEVSYEWELPKLTSPPVPENITIENVTGMIQVILNWTQYVDLELLVDEPNGDRIYWGHNCSNNGGRLYPEIGCDNWIGNPFEIISWDANATLFDGKYNVSVYYRGDCSTSNPGIVPFNVSILMESQERKDYSCTVNRTKTTQVTAINIP